MDDVLHVSWIDPLILEDVRTTLSLECGIYVKLRAVDFVIPIILWPFDPIKINKSALLAAPACNSLLIYILSWARTASKLISCPHA